MAGKLEAALRQARLEAELAQDKARDLQEENDSLLQRLGGAHGADGEGHSQGGSASLTTEDRTDAAATMAAAKAAAEKYRSKAHKLQQVAKAMREELGKRAAAKEAAESELDRVQEKAGELERAVLDLETGLAQAKRENYFAAIERQHLQEELVEQRLGCRCRSGCHQAWIPEAELSKATSRSSQEDGTEDEGVQSDSETGGVERPRCTRRELARKHRVRASAQETRVRDAQAGKNRVVAESATLLRDFFARLSAEKSEV